MDALGAVSGIRCTGVRRLYHLSGAPAVAFDIAFDFEDGQRLAFLGTPDQIHIRSDLTDYYLPPDKSVDLTAASLTSFEETGIGYLVPLPVPDVDLTNTVVGRRLTGSTLMRRHGALDGVKLEFDGAMWVELIAVGEDLLVQVPQPEELILPTTELYPANAVEAPEFSSLLGRQLEAIHRRLDRDPVSGAARVSQVILEWTHGLSSELYWGNNGAFECSDEPREAEEGAAGRKACYDSPPILAPLSGSALSKVWEFTEASSLGLWFGNVSLALVASSRGVSIQPSPWVELSELRY